MTTWGHPDDYEKLFRLAESRIEAEKVQNRRSWTIVGIAYLFLVSITILAGWWVLR